MAAPLEGPQALPAAQESLHCAPLLSWAQPVCPGRPHPRHDCGRRQRGGRGRRRRRRACGWATRAAGAGAGQLKADPAARAGWG